MHAIRELEKCNGPVKGLITYCKSERRWQARSGGVNGKVLYCQHWELRVAPQLTVVTSTIARSGVAVSVKDALAAAVVPSETTAPETTAVRASSSHGR